MARGLKTVTATAVALLLSACAAQEPGLRVLNRVPHQTDAFTQGLLLHDGELFESTGLYGESSLRQLDPLTGAVLRQVDLTDRYFGEGLALVGDSLIMLTWQENEALVFERDTFKQTGSFAYEGEGWGLCFDGSSLVMSDGSSRLQYRDPVTFELESQVQVTRPDGRPLPLLNELECVGSSVYANVFTTTYIVRIDEGGQVGAVYDLRNLLTEEEWAGLDEEAVLNGIAYNDESGTFLVTGKLWPWMFELQID